MLLKYTDETKPFLKIFASFYPIIDTFFGVFSASWVKIPYNETSLLTSKANIEDEQNSSNWKVNISLKSENYEENISWFGVNVEADKNLDKFDFRKPRAIMDIPNIYFNRSDWGNEFRYMATDIRQEFNESQKWEFTVELPNSDIKNYSLEFHNINKIPLKFDVTLYDIEKNRYINLRNDSLYQFTPTKTSLNFKIYVGDKTETEEKQTIPDKYVLSNYPNPFNPSTKIFVNLLSNDYGKVVIYNVLGKEIRTVYTGIISQGQNTYEWDGKDESDVVQTSGIYIYRLITNSGINISNKMILMK